jgi:hypothetical protein
MNLHTRTHLGQKRYQVTVTLDPGDPPPVVGTAMTLEDMGTVEVETSRKIREHLRREIGEELYDLVVRTGEGTGRLPNR